MTTDSTLSGNDRGTSSRNSAFGGAAPADSAPNALAALVAPRQPPFGVNEMRLNAREWLATLATVVIAVVAAPRLWQRFEPLNADADYRLPYALSDDYWLYERRLEQTAGAARIPILGDSVVWGEYVRPDGTLSHFLDAQSSRSDRFVNCGINGLFPLALEGLIEHYGDALRNRRVIVHCNLLWMTSPKADLSTQKEEAFNHSRLVPQFYPRIPCYKAGAETRLSAAIENHVAFFAWANHLQTAYYDQKSIADWTLEEDGSEPPKYVNAWRNPLAPLAAGLPGEPANDPQRGPTSARHKPWNTGGAEPSPFEWVEPPDSLQWQAFQRVVRILKSRNDDVLVILGPFNEHMIPAEQRPTFRNWQKTIVSWLAENHVAAVVPDALPSELYADASHPLTQGYRLLASRLLETAELRAWALER
ncbi:MAG TPA: hypothetical protein VHX65_16365 [Pirellulales bacterium]|jgi:hypothetical protein|nr:hypothetical protein [Pirellulales bacterium]